MLRRSVGRRVARQGRKRSIGCATFLMATVGILIGRFIGEKFGRIAEAIGGIGLIVIGVKILMEHTLVS